MCKALCEHFNVLYEDEFARDYLKDIGPNYTYDDLREIAEGQWTIEKYVANYSAPFSIHDTDLLTIRIWSELKYGKCHPWIAEKTESFGDKCYIVLEPVIPWTSDPLRENPEDRDVIHQAYMNFIHSRDLLYFYVDEKEFETRFTMIANWLNSKKE